MKKLVFSLLFTCSFVFSFAQKIRLFNGNDLTGWTVHGIERWDLDGGDLVS